MIVVAKRSTNYVISLGFLKRRKDMDLAAFSQHWSTVHRDLALRLPAIGTMRGYVQNHRIDAAIPGIPQLADGAPQLWLPDIEASMRLIQSEAYRTGAYLDEPNFMDHHNVGIVGHETVVDDGIGWQVAATMVKVILVFKRASHLSEVDFSRWTSVPNPLWLPNARPLRLVRITAASRAVTDIRPQAFDGAELSWWPSPQAFLAAWRARCPGKAAAWIDLDSTEGFLADEQYVLVPPQEYRLPSPRMEEWVMLLANSLSAPPAST